MRANKMDALMQRRAELLGRIAAQREQLTEFGARFSSPMGLLDKGRGVVSYLYSHPLLAASGVVLVVLRRRSLLGMAGGVWSLWKVYRTASKLSQSLARDLGNQQR
ncbi:MAG: YqjK-like family protein [Gallionella sp.]|nr:YqjK-like family protein [Gallionella sp.]